MVDLARGDSPAGGPHEAVQARRVDCPHAAACGGCPLIDREYGAQLEFKANRVRRAFDRFPLLERVALEPIHPAGPIEHYRTRAKLVVGPGGVGLYGAGGHGLVDLPGCRVLPSELAAVVERVRRAVRSGEIVASDGATAGLRGVDLRSSATEDGVLTTLIVDDEPTARAAAEQFARVLLSELPACAGVAIAPHSGERPRLLASGAYIVAGRARVRDRIGAVELIAGPGAFVQAHRGQAEHVHALVSAHVGASQGSRVLDLYAGGGAIGLALARAGARVTLVESFGGAVEDARASAALNNLTVDTFADDADSALDVLAQRRAHFDAVVLNPPRRGCTASVREKVARLGPARIAYVSCDPETLARDLDHFRRLGYATSAASPIDMIPLTEEVETVARLVRAPAPHPPILFEDDALLVIDRWADEPLAPHPSRVASTLARIRRRAGWERAVALFSPDEATSGVCALVRAPALLGAWRGASVARATYTLLVRGVTHGAGTLRGKLGAPASTARYRRLGIAGGQSLLSVVVEIANAARLRADLQSIGHPVVGDERFGHAPTNRHFAERHALSRAFAHVSSLDLIDPRTGRELRFESALAPELAMVLDRVGGQALHQASSAADRAT